MPKTQEETIAAIRNGANTRAKLSAALGIPRSSCNHRVVRLINLGLVREFSGGPKCYTIQVVERKGGA